MVNESKSLAGRKGGAVRRAKARAAQMNAPVFDAEFGFLISPNGNQTEVPDGLAPAGALGIDFLMNEPAASAVKPEAVAAPVDVGGPVDETGDYLPPETGPRDVTAADVDDDDTGEGEDPPAMVDEMKAEPVGEIIETDFTPQPGSVIDEMNRLLGQGVSEDDALTLINAKRGAVHTPMGTPPPRGPEQAATPGGGEHLGPDPTIVARYKEMMKTYVAPRADLKITVENPDGGTWEAVVKLRYLPYLIKAAALEAAKRRRPVNIADKIQMIVRTFKANDTDTAILMGTLGGTGPADTFNKQTGVHERA